MEKLKLKENFVNFYDRWREHPKVSGYRDYYTNVRLTNGAIAEIQLHSAAMFELARNGDHYLYEFVRVHRGNPEMSAYVKRTLDIQHEFYSAAADGRYSKLSQGIRNLFLELARELSGQNTPEGAVPILNRLSMIVDNELKAGQVSFRDNPEIKKLIDEDDSVTGSPADADVLFRDDPAFALRALQFKGRYGFRFSEKVETAMRQHAREYMALLTPESASSTLRAMFRDGCSARNVDTLMEYGVFASLFPAVKDICGTEAYRKYAARAMEFLDRQLEAGIKVPDGLFVALLLRPALERSTVEEILNAQGAVYGWGEGERESVERILRSAAPEALEDAA